MDFGLSPEDFGLRPDYFGLRHINSGLSPGIFGPCSKDFGLSVVSD